MFLVKRVIGLPGERIELAHGRVVVDGQPLVEPWAPEPTFPNASWTVPDGAVFLLGDRRSVSAGDGRSTGPVPVARVDWLVVARYRPLARASLLTRASAPP
jgi:signal peptidase I